MSKQATHPELLHLLNQALARELQVCVQYMLQHGIGAGLASAATAPPGKRDKFVASHSMVWMPGVTLKKIAVTEMHHAEAITERVVQLGGEPTTQPDHISFGTGSRDMLEHDRHEEQGAIELYRHIIEVATERQDEATAKLFRQILADEEKHLSAFSAFLVEG